MRDKKSSSGNKLKTVLIIIPAVQQYLYGSMVLLSTLVLSS